jgi:hypothetical protein
VQNGGAHIREVSARRQTSELGSDIVLVMTTNFRRSLAATGAATLLTALGALATMQPASAMPATPAGSPGTLSGNVVHASSGDDDGVVYIDVYDEANDSVWGSYQADASTVQGKKIGFTERDGKIWGLTEAGQAYDGPYFTVQDLGNTTYYFTVTYNGKVLMGGDLAPGATSRKFDL